MKKTRKYFLLTIIMAILISVPVMAQDMSDVIKGINTVWVLMASFLVFFMQAGFGMVEAGFIRAKSSVNILMKNMLDFSMASLGYYIFGFAIMFGAGNLFFGKTGFFLFSIPAEMNGVPTLAFWFFQAVFAAAAATIVAGALAERLNFKAYLIYSFIISAFIYPLIGHWIWSNGWLANLGFLDFAGSTVVHAVGGSAAFIGALLLGPRIGKYNKDGTANAILGHNLPLAALGTLILWFGWFGFNPGSTLSAMDAGAIAKIAVNTNLAAATGAIVAMFITWRKFGKPDFGMTMNGSLAGLVAITAGCAFVQPMSAILIGLAAGFIVVYGVIFIDKIHVDDPVGAVAVHGMCGIFGTLAVGIFHETQGLLLGGGLNLLKVQAIGVFSVVAFVIASMFIVFKCIDKVIGLRVSREDELRGVDISEHGAEAYADFPISALS
ncbi:MAG: ammonium transporter [Nanoarchaeota archaeon]|nr:ammonium transporter [Nanoarchaeota archaeon]MBU1704553.1 ammonium transporter [Nanoarchaeota archaeon]